MPAITIRPYRDGDQTGLHWLNARTPPAGQVAYEPQPPEEEIDRIPEVFLAFWVAVHSDGQREGIAGCLGLIDGDSDQEVVVPDALHTSERTVRLHIMRVAPEVQRTGTGRMLYAAAEAWAIEHKFERMILDTTPQQEAAVHFYRAMGFDEVARSMAGRYELVWFSKLLSGTGRSRG